MRTLRIPHDVLKYLIAAAPFAAEHFPDDEKENLRVAVETAIDIISANHDWQELDFISQEPATIQQFYADQRQESIARLLYQYRKGFSQ